MWEPNSVLCSHPWGHKEQHSSCFFPQHFHSNINYFLWKLNRSIDGKIYPGIIKEKASAQKEYDTAISRGQSAGLVKYVGILSKVVPMLFLSFLFGWGQVKTLESAASAG